MLPLVRLTVPVLKMVAYRFRKNSSGPGWVPESFLKNSCIGQQIRNLWDEGPFLLYKCRRSLDSWGMGGGGGGLAGPCSVKAFSVAEVVETRGSEHQKGMCKRPGVQCYQHCIWVQWRILWGLQMREAFLHLHFRNTIVWGGGWVNREERKGREITHRLDAES